MLVSSKLRICSKENKLEFISSPNYIKNYIALELNSTLSTSNEPLDVISLIEKPFLLKNLRAQPREHINFKSISLENLLA